MLPQEVILKKRAGKALNHEEIQFFTQGLTNNNFTESQASALAMAIYFQGMDRDECVHLTQGLQQSGTTLKWQQFQLNGPIVDKHSTGGVGDKVSIMLAPMLAACGAHVPMISGRGLGHTGGTLDKMDSIPGYNTSPNVELFQNIVAKTGCAIVGQTAELAPADKRLYGIRDITGTVESIPLITASILSKKLSAGLDSLVMDVKVGSGSFNADFDMAKNLAINLVKVGDGFGLPVSAVLTDMDQVLGTTAGNALEIIETIDYLTKDVIDPRLHEVTVELGAELLLMSQLASSIEDARSQMNHSLDSGKAAEYFARMVTDLGGPTDLIEQKSHYFKTAPIVQPVFSDKSGKQTISSINGREIGNAVVALGGGRVRAEDCVDHSVGLTDIKGLGDQVDENEPLMVIHANTQQDADDAALRIQAAIEYSSSEIKVKSAIVDKITQKSLNLIEQG